MRWSSEATGIQPRFDQVATQLRARIEALEGFSKEPENAGRQWHPG